MTWPLILMSIHEEWMNKKWMITLTRKGLFFSSSEICFARIVNFHKHTFYSMLTLSINMYTNICSVLFVMFVQDKEDLKVPMKMCIGTHDILCPYYSYCIQHWSPHLKCCFIQGEKLGATYTVYWEAVQGCKRRPDALRKLVLQTKWNLSFSYKEVPGKGTLVMGSTCVMKGMPLYYELKT